MEEAFVLESIYLTLVSQGLRLSVRDYRDALRALRLGHGLYERDQLRWLCRTLWASSDDEARLIDLLFQKIALPSSEEIAHYTSQAEKQDNEDINKGTANDSIPRYAEANEELGSSAIFVSPDQQGFALPQAQVYPINDETFILTPQPLISLRSLIVAWRRFRMASRVGLKVEIDMVATVAERCRLGVLDAPVMRPARQNQAQLTLLIDASDSMAPWAGFCAQLVASLHESRLGYYQIYYYHNTPEDALFRQPTLLDLVSLDSILSDSRPSSLLIISDGGAARRTWSPSRFTETRRFIRRVGDLWRPIAWLNPMPVRRWAGTTAERISRLPQIAMFDLSDEHMIDAIDLLRGQRCK